MVSFCFFCVDISFLSSLGPDLAFKGWRSHFLVSTPQLYRHFCIAAGNICIFFGPNNTFSLCPGIKATHQRLVVSYIDFTACRKGHLKLGVNTQLVLGFLYPLTGLVWQQKLPVLPLPAEVYCKRWLTVCGS